MQSLKPSRQFGGVLAYTSMGFTDNVADECREVIELLRHTFKETDLADRIVHAVEVCQPYTSYALLTPLVHASRIIIL